MQDVIAAITDGAKLVVLDPRLSNIASKANWWLPIKPATDLAILLAWIKIIVDEGLYDKDYVSKYAIGLDKLKEAVKECTPEWGSAETEIPAETIVTIAREMAKHKPHVCVCAGRHNAWYGNDIQRIRAIAILNALMGSWGREGGYYLRPKGTVPKYPGIPEYPRPEKPPLGYPFTFGLPTTEAIRNASITGEPYPVKGWIVYAFNLIKAMPNPKATKEAIKNLDLMVVVDVLPTDTVNFADVVFPECTYLERYDDLKIGKLEMFEVSLRQPVVKPMFETKPTWWIARELGIRLGLEEYFPWKDAEEYLRARCDAAGVDFEELKQRGVIRYPEKAKSYITPTNKPTFNTPSGKIELYSKQLADQGFDPLPKYSKHDEPPPGYFRLFYGRNSLHSFSRTTNNFMLTDLVPENELWINSKKAKELGIKNGEHVSLVNQDGIKSPTEIKVKITERIREDCVFMAHGFGALSRGLTRAYHKGVGVETLITRYKIDPITGATGMRVNFVKIIKEA